MLRYTAARSSDGVPANPTRIVEQLNDVHPQSDFHRFPGTGGTENSPHNEVPARSLKTDHIRFFSKSAGVGSRFPEHPQKRICAPV